jgi:hypothetical protein
MQAGPVPSRQGIWVYEPRFGSTLLLLITASCPKASCCNHTGYSR